LPDKFVTLNSVIQWLSVPAFGVLLLLPGVLCLIAGFTPWRRRVNPSLAFVLVFTALFPPIALGVVVFGDGYAGTTQQFHLGMTVLLAFWTVALLGGVAACGKALAGRRADRRGAAESTAGSDANSAARRAILDTP
jgi:hypothetical protein